MFSQCPERKKGNSRKPGPQVFALQHEEAPTVNNFAGTLSIASQDAYTLIDTRATHSCMSEEYKSACTLPVEILTNVERLYGYTFRA